MLPLALLSGCAGPSMTADELRTLAAHSKPPADAAAWVILDEQSHTIEKARATLRGRRTIQILSPRAESEAEQRIVYAPARQRARVVHARLLSPGTREEKVPARAVAAGFDERDNRAWLTVRFPRAAVGSILDLEYEIETRTSAGWSYFEGWTPRSAPFPVAHWRWRLSAARDAPVRVRAWNVAEPPREDSSGPRRTYTFAMDDLPDLENQPGRPLAGDFLSQPQILFTTALDEAAVVGALARSFRAAAAADAQVAGSARARCEAAKSKEQRVRLLYAYVADELRLVPRGTWQDDFRVRPAAEVLRSGVGDGKDKCALLCALLSAVGIESDLVLTTAGLLRAPPDAFPCGLPFTHPILCARGDDGGRWYLDPAARYCPSDVLPEDVSARRALLVSSDASTPSYVDLPESSGASNRRSATQQALLDPTGDLSVEETVVLSGVHAHATRNAFADASPVDWLRLLSSEGEQVSECKPSGLDQDAPLSVTRFYRLTRHGKAAGGRLFAAAPVSPPRADRPLEGSPRITPFHAGAPATWEWEGTLSPPPGFRPAAVPDAWQRATPFGDAAVSYVRAGSAVSYRISLRRNLRWIAAGDYEAYVLFLEQFRAAAQTRVVAFAVEGDGAPPRALGKGRS